MVQWTESIPGSLTWANHLISLCLNFPICKRVGTQLFLSSVDEGLDKSQLLVLEYDLDLEKSFDLPKLWALGKSCMKYTWERFSLAI